MEISNKDNWFSETDFLLSTRLKLRGLVKGTQRGWEGANCLFFRSNLNSLPILAFQVGAELLKNCPRKHASTCKSLGTF